MIIGDRGHRRRPRARARALAMSRPAQGLPAGASAWGLMRNGHVADRQHLRFDLLFFMTLPGVRWRISGQEDPVKPSLDVFEVALSVGVPSPSLLDIIRLNMIDSGVPLDARGWERLPCSDKLARIRDGLQIAREVGLERRLLLIG